jgi:hypothetical protein
LEIDGKAGTLADVGPVLTSMGAEAGRVRTRLEQEIRNAA